LSVYLPTAQIDELYQRATARGETVSAVVRRLLARRRRARPPTR
jgi:hypothetical protein